MIDTLIKVMNDSVIKGTSDWHSLAHVNDILAANEKLVSALVTYTETYRVIPITLPNLGKLLRLNSIIQHLISYFLFYRLT